MSSTDDVACVRMMPLNHGSGDLCVRIILLGCTDYVDCVYGSYRLDVWIMSLGQMFLVCTDLVACVSGSCCLCLLIMSLVCVDHVACVY